MADHTTSHNRVTGDDEHTRTYEGFLIGSVALTILCLFICVSLIMFRFGHFGSVFFGFSGLIAGCLAVLIDVRTGAKWYLSSGLLVLFGLFTAFNVS